jgi:hypothetical protein
MELYRFVESKKEPLTIENEAKKEITWQIFVGLKYIEVKLNDKQLIGIKITCIGRGWLDLNSRWYKFLLQRSSCGWIWLWRGRTGG